jgi:hypothetical protein
MDSKIGPLEVYITLTNINDARSEKNYATKEEAESNQQWGEDFIVAKLLHIVETI